MKNNVFKRGVTFEKIYFLFVIPLFILCILTLLGIRLVLGVDLTDEAFYAVLPKVFANGYRPFLDEILLVQPFAVLLFPLVKSYLFFNHSGDGLILFLRIVFFFSLCVNSFFIVLALKRRYRIVEALLTGLLLLCFWPFSIPALSYNTLSSFLFSSGLLILIAQQDQKKVSNWFSVSLVFFLLSTFCYPTYLIPIAISLGFFYFSTAKKYPSKKTNIQVLLFLVFALVATCYMVSYIGLERLFAIYHFTKSYAAQGGGIEKVEKIIFQVKDNFTFLCLLIGGIWLICYAFKRQAWISFLLFLAWTIALFLFPTSHLTVPSFHLIIVGLVVTSLPASFELIRMQVNMWSALPLIACSAGLAFAWTSSNGLTNFAVGATVGVVGFGHFIFKNMSGIKFGRHMSTALIMCIISLQVRYLYQSVYGDDSTLANLNVKIAEGPYLGLYTGKEKSQFLKMLQMDLITVAPEAKTVAFFESLTAGYLFTNLKIQAPTVWIYSQSQFPYDRNVISSFYENPINRPDLIFWAKSIPVNSTFSFQLENKIADPVRKNILPYYHLAIERPHYLIYIKNPSADGD